MIDEKLKNLLSVLGYEEESGKYYTLKNFSKELSLSPLSRIISRINKDNPNAKIHGAYVIKSYSDNDESHQIYNEPEILYPVVFVAQANTILEARELHRSLWNASSAPFIIIRLPNEIRVYTGFDYDKRNEKHGLIQEIQIENQTLFDDLPLKAINALREFYSAEAIDDGSIWQKLKNAPQERFNYDNRVDKRLLKNLEDLEKKLIEKLPNLSRKNVLKYIHAIIGKYIYFQYLHDRDILTDKWAKKRDIDLDKVLNRGATLSELIKLNDAIEECFEGKIFPFPDGFKDVFNSEIVDLVASVFYGDTAHGERVLFGMYDFSYIPIETLSYVYEQFLKSQGLSKKHGAVYTPESLADYLINEISTVKPLKLGMKILDPCCGSGIFLVLTYRYLIELKLQRHKVENLAPDDLKQIMENSIHGVEINLEACYVTEFSLILTLLNYLEPPDLSKYGRFKFPNLHNKNIFEGDFFDPKKAFYPLTMTFDWIIGNPPWKAINIEKNPDDENALDWVKTNAKSRPVGGNRIEGAFAWRATEFVAEDGCVGFVLPAKRLFNNNAKKFRQEFFTQNEVCRITNFSNFHYLIFQADVSPITVIYQKANSEKPKRPIWHYSPFVANQIIALLRKGKPTQPIWAIVINKSEIKMVSYKDAENGDALTWKMALWASYECERTFFRLRSTFSETLGSIIKKKRWQFHEGVRLRGETDEGNAVESIDKFLSEDSFQDLRFFDAEEFGKTQYKFHIPSSVLKIIPEEKKFISKKAIPGIFLTAPPHLILNSQYAIYSEMDFVIENSYAIASASEYALYLKAMSTYLSSTLCRFLLFFLSPQWGIERTKLDGRDWRKLPVPSFSANELNSLVELQNLLSEKEKSGEDREILQKTLDDAVEQILKIPASIRILIHDFFNVKMTLNKGKAVKVKAVMKPNPNTDLEKYARRLRYELDEFAEGGKERHLIQLIYSDDLIVCRVNIVETEDVQDFKIEKAVGNTKETLAGIKKGIQERFSQWIYIQRELRFFDKTGETFYICKSPRLIDWTESQAISDANDLIGEALEKIDMNPNSFAQIENYETSFIK